MKRLLMWIFLAVLAVGVALPAWAAPQVTMTVRAASDGRVKPGGWVTVLAEVRNQGGDLAGEVVVEQAAPTGTTWENHHPTYAVQVALPAGGTKRIPVTVPMQPWSNSLRVTFVVGGKELDRQTVNLTMLPTEQVMVGLLSSDEQGLPALGQMGKSSPLGTAQLVRFDAETFPNASPLLTGFDVIAIDRFDTAALNADQVKALEAWVGRGGTLLLAGGPEWKRSFAGLPAALVPVKVTDVAETDLAPLGAEVGKPLTGKGAISVGTVLRGQTPVKAGDLPLLVTAPVGSGKVVYLAVDPTLNPVAAWNGLADLLDRHVAPPARLAGNRADNGDGPILNALQRIPGMGMPSVMLIAALLGGYALLVGPLGYLVLKRIDKREWAWATVPLLSVLFVAAVWGVSSGRRLPLMSHLITVTELSPGTGSGTMQSYVGLYAPAQRTLTVPVQGARLIKPLGYNGGPQVSGDARVVFGEKQHLELTGMNSYDLRGVAMEQDVAVRGGLEVTELRYAKGVLTGRVVNHLDQPLSDVRVAWSGGGSVQVGQLAAGAASEPFSLDVGAVDNPKMAMGGQIFQPVNMPQPGATDPEGQRRNAVLEAVFGFGGIGRVRTAGVTVVGWSATPVAPPPVSDLGRSFGGANLVYSVLPQAADPTTGDLPPDLVLGMPKGDKAVGMTPTGYLLPPGSHPFTMQIPGYKPEKVGEVTLYLRNYNQAAGMTVRAKNRKTGEWVQLQSTSQTLANWADLISADGTLDLTIDVTVHTEMGQPTIGIKGVGR